MPYKDLHDKPFDERTLAKLELFERYAREWIPTWVMQGTDTITDEQVKQVEDNLNNRPLKSLGYKSPNDVYFKELEQLTRVALTA